MASGGSGGVPRPSSSEQGLAVREALVALAIEMVVCPRCEAKPGSECVTLSQEEASETHRSRVLPLWMAYDMGHAETAQ